MHAAFADALRQMAKPIVERSERFLSMIVGRIVLNGGAFAAASRTSEQKDSR
jgi:hypothetical protein